MKGPDHTIWHMAFTQVIKFQINRQWGKLQMLRIYFCLNKQHIKHCEFCIVMEIQKVERECTILREELLWKSCYIKIGTVVLIFLQGHFSRHNQIKIAICNHYRGIIVFYFINMWPYRTSVLSPQLSLDIQCCVALCLSAALESVSFFKLFCSSVKSMASRNKVISLDWIWVLQNFCSVFISILLPICLHTSSKWEVLIRIWGLQAKSWRVKYKLDIYVDFFFFHTHSILYYVHYLKKHELFSFYPSISHSAHIYYFRKKKIINHLKKQEICFQNTWQSISHQLHGIWIDTGILPSFCATRGWLFSSSKAADELPSK